MVLITSVINAKNNSFFTPEQRLEQLIDLTIPSIVKHIPDNYMVLLEGSNLNQNQKDIIKSSGVKEAIQINVDHIPKSLGELALITYYIKSTFFKNKRNDYKTLSKISARYFLLNGFNFNPEENVIKKWDPNTTWSKQGLCDTRYYRTVNSNFDNYIDGLQKISNDGILLDIEHSFYQYNLIPTDKINQKIHLGGYMAPDGVYIED